MTGAGMPLPSWAKRSVTSPSGLNWNMRALATTASTSCSVPLQQRVAQRAAGAAERTSSAGTGQRQFAGAGTCTQRRSAGAAKFAAPCTAAPQAPALCSCSLDLSQVAPAAAGVGPHVESIPQPGAIAHPPLNLWLGLCPGCIRVHACLHPLEEGGGVVLGAAAAAGQGWCGECASGGRVWHRVHARRACRQAGRCRLRWACSGIHVCFAE